MLESDYFWWITIRISWAHSEWAAPEETQMDNPGNTYDCDGTGSRCDCMTRLYQADAQIAAFAENSNVLGLKDLENGTASADWGLQRSFGNAVVDFAQLGVGSQGLLWVRT